MKRKCPVKELKAYFLCRQGSERGTAKNDQGEGYPKSPSEQKEETVESWVERQESREKIMITIRATSRGRDQVVEKS